MSPQPDSKINPLLWKAIEERRLVRLLYKNRLRIIEPHDYGIHKGSAKLLAYQIGGSSTQKLPNWRWMEEDLISEIELLNRTFAGGRTTLSGTHHRWDRLFIRVEPANNTDKRKNVTLSEDYGDYDVPKLIRGQRSEGTSMVNTIELDSSMKSAAQKDVVNPFVSRPAR